ncbi:MAG: protein kinase [Chloroflexota bacterium]
MTYKLYLFGPPRLELENESITIPRKKAQALLAYLVMTQQPHSRDALATLFWPDLPQSKARANLRRELARVRSAVDPELLQVDRETMGVERNDALWVDVLHFQAALHKAQACLIQENHTVETVCEVCLPHLNEAADYYSDNFLAGFTLPDAPDFDEWQFFQTEELRQLLSRSLRQLLQGYQAQQDPDAALPHARRLLSLDPLHEPTYRDLMRLYEQTDQRAAALRLYQVCIDTFDKELGVAPELETTTLALEIRQRGGDVGERIAGIYLLDRREENLLGAGGMGTVYRGLDTQTREPVAIKILKPELTNHNPDIVERFKREGEALTRINHPNIVKMLAMTEQAGQHYLVLEYVDGGSLRDLLDETGKFSVERTLEVSLELADALTRIHHLDIVHRDLKPANIMLTQNGKVRLTDFGVAHLPKKTQLTQTGMVLGTIDYLSPEACQGGVIDARSDIWSFGVIMWEMLTGQRPFNGADQMGTLTAILTHPTPQISDSFPTIPQPLAFLIQQMLRKDAADRTASMRLVASALEAIKANRNLPDALLAETPQNTNDAWALPLTETAAPTPPPSPFQAPAVPPFFVGRDDVSAQLDAALAQADGPIQALVGMGGLGKTTLAAYTAQRLRSEFPDGVLWANVTNSQTQDILVNWGQAYNYDFSGLADLESRAAAVRGVLADKHVLIVLDNVDTQSQVTPLLPNSPTCAVLMTTRNLDAANAVNAQTVMLSELEPTSSVELFTAIVGETRVSAEPDAAEKICEQLYHLPLAIEIAAQRLKSRPRIKLAAMAERLSDELHRLDLGISDRAVRSSFMVSWEQLTPALQDVFAILGVFSGRPFTADAIATIADLNPFTAEDALYELVALSLVQEESDIYFKQHPLLADFAHQRLGQAHDVYARLTDYYYDFVTEFHEDYDTLEPEWANINAAIETAYGQENWGRVIGFTDVLADTWLARIRYSEARQAYSLAYESGQKLNDENLLASTLLRWGEACIEQSDHDEAAHRLQEGLRYFEKLNDLGGATNAQYQLIIVALEKNNYEQAELLINKVQVGRQNLGDKVGLAKLLIQRANLYFDLSKFEEAQKSAEASLNMLQDVDDKRISLP